VAELEKNYGISEGCCSRTGKPVFNKLSCQSLRVFPAPPGYWEQELCIPVRGTGPEARKQREDVARGMMFRTREFVSCRHPDCWICMGQEEHPTPEQIAAFNPPPSTTGPPQWGVLSGEEWLFNKPERRSKRARVLGFLRRWWDRRSHGPTDTNH
jgi:hypothetical protein